MTDKRVILTTAGSADEAKKIARELVGQRLAACVNIVARIDSVYRWKEKVEEAQEYLLVIKTSAALVARLRDSLHELHSYEVPEFVVLTVEDGSAAYLKWIDASVGPDARDK